MIVVRRKKVKYYSNPQMIQIYICLVSWNGSWKLIGKSDILTYKW